MLSVHPIKQYLIILSTSFFQFLFPKAIVSTYVTHLYQIKYISITVMTLKQQARIMLFT